VTSNPLLKMLQSNNFMKALAVVGALGALAGIGNWVLNHERRTEETWNRAVDLRVAEVLKSQGVNDALSKLQQTSTETNTVLKTLEPFIQDIVRHEFESASRMPPREIGLKLSAVRDLLAVARNQQIKVDPAITTALSKHLLDVPPNATYFWQVAGELISYRSINSAPSISALSSNTRLGNCTDLEPNITTQTISFIDEKGHPFAMKHNIGVYNNCQIELDSPTDGDRLNSFLARDIPTIVFTHCVVIYRGGPLKLILNWEHHVIDSVQVGKGAATLSVSGNSLTFNDCLFDFSVPQSSPSAEVQQLTKLVLSQSGARVELPLTKPLG